MASEISHRRDEDEAQWNIAAAVAALKLLMAAILSCEH